jgi:hypothetical protein
MPRRAMQAKMQLDDAGKAEPCAVHAAVVSLSAVPEESPGWVFLRANMPKAARDALVRLHQVQIALASRPQ